MNPAWAWTASGLDLLMKDKQESMAGSRTSSVQLSSCGPGLPPPPDFGPPAWGRGPGGGTALAAGEGAQSGSTALRRWRLWSRICKRNMPRAKDINWELWIIHMMHTQTISSLSQNQFRQSVSEVLWIANVCGQTIVQWASRERSVWCFQSEISEIYEFKALFQRKLCEQFECC